jgi:hypothetical protein
MAHEEYHAATSRSKCFREWWAADSGAKRKGEAMNEAALEKMAIREVLEN